MNLTAFIDVAIGLSLIYLGASLYVTVINEFVAQAFRMRSKQLAVSLVSLIDCDDLKGVLKKSPSLKPFFDSAGRPGSYVDTDVLARLLVGGLRDGSKDVATMEELVKAIGALPGDSNLKAQLSALAQSVADDVDKFVKSVSEWADRSLTMLGEVYKKRMQLISFGIGLGVAVILNLDTLGIVTHLYHDKQAREAAVSVALQLTEKTEKDVFDKCMAMTPDERRSVPECAPMSGLVDTVLKRNETLGELPIGWESWGQAMDQGVPGLNLVWIGHWAGWLLTALAVSLGAPFWFDLLNRLINIRHGMRRPEVAKS